MAINPDSSSFNVDETLKLYKSSLGEFYNVKLLQFIEEIQSEKETVDIDDIYVDLMCEPYSMRGKGLFSNGKATSCKDTLVVLENDKERRSKMNMVILGLPGAGKTTLLRFLLKRYTEQSKVIPLYIELKSEVASQFGEVLEKESKVVFNDFKTYIISYFTTKIGEDAAKQLVANISTDLFTKKYELVFFCDGLDEISPAQYRQFTAVVNKASTFVGCQFIISSRQIGFYASDYSDRFKLYCLMDFDDDAQKNYIDKYFKKINKPELESRKNNLLQVLDNKTDIIISKLAKSPILLSLLCVTPNIKNIHSKAQLFQNAIDVLLSNRKIEQKEDKELFIQFLKELAVVFFKLDKAESFDKAELEFYANRFFCSQGESASCTLLKQKYLECGLFDKSERADSYKFAHRTIWEYLVAAGMLERDPNEIYSRSNMGVWQEPIKMYVSLAGQVKKDNISEVIQKIWYENKALALSCMNEFDPFPTDILDNLYGNLSRREKLSLIATLRNSYINYNGSFRNPVINTIRETLTLIHKVEKDCEVIYAYLTFLEEFRIERIFSELLEDFLQLKCLSRRQQLLESFGLEFAYVAPGTFNMGRNKINTRSLSREEIDDRIVVDDYEIPEHRVKIKNPFSISKTLITNQMYFNSQFPYADRTHMYNTYSDQPTQPVNFVNWYEAMVFAKWFGYDLPSEVQWEYACRGGNGKNDFMSDKISEIQKILDEKVNYTGDKTNKTRNVIPINHQYANSLDLVDMIGNLREWCSDWFSEDYYSKCIVESYPSFQDDIEGREEVSYYWGQNADGQELPKLIVNKNDLNDLEQNIFTFDKNGYCIEPTLKYMDKIEAKSLRGGCFDWSIANLRPTYRNHNPANNVYKVNGFRVVKKEESNE